MPHPRRSFKAMGVSAKSVAMYPLSHEWHRPGGFSFNLSPDMRTENGVGAESLTSLFHKLLAFTTAKPTTVVSFVKDSITCSKSKSIRTFREIAIVLQ